MDPTLELRLARSGSLVSRLQHCVDERQHDQVEMVKELIPRAKGLSG